MGTYGLLKDERKANDLQLSWSQGLAAVSVLRISVFLDPHPKKRECRWTFSAIESGRLRVVARNEAHSVADVSSIVLLRTGEVVSTTDPTLPWHIAKLDQNQDIVLIDDFLRELAANDCSAQTLRSYSFDLLRWWRFLDARGHRWDVATRTDTRDFVLWMRQARTKGYRPATINHALSVVSVFYEH